MSAPASPVAPPPSAPPSSAESCPLCGAPLAPEQEWCLRCGAAARTRLAAAPKWRAPLITLVVVAALALGVLAAALVKLAADSGPTPPAATSVLTTTATSSLPGAASTLPTTPDTTPTGNTITLPAPSGSSGAANQTGSPAGAGASSATTGGKGRLRGLSKLKIKLKLK